MSLVIENDLIDAVDSTIIDEIQMCIRDRVCTGKLGIICKTYDYKCKKYTYQIHMFKCLNSYFQHTEITKTKHQSGL